MKKFLLLLFLTISAVASAATKYVKTDITDLQAGDVILIVDTNSNKALGNDNGTGSAPTAVDVTIVGNEIASAADKIKFVFGISDGKYTFNVPNSTNYLYCTNTNNGVRVGTNTNKTFEWDTTAGTNGYLKNVSTSRYIGVYNNSDWRCYTSTGTNISATITAFFKEVNDGEGGGGEGGDAYVAEITGWEAFFNYSHTDNNVGQNTINLTGTDATTGVTINIKNPTSGNQYVKASDLRLYNGWVMVFTAPSGKKISKIETTLGSTKSANSNSTVTSNPAGMATTGTAKWEGASPAKVVTWTITGTTSFKTITVTLVDSDEEDPEITVATPTFTPASGATLAVDSEIEIECETEGATIYYTTNGDTPDDTAEEYLSGVTLDTPGTITVKAIAYKDDVASEVATATYNVTAAASTTDREVKINGGWLTVFNTTQRISGSDLIVEKNKYKLEGTVDGVTITIENGSATNAYIKAEEFRFYKGYILTFQAPENYTITKIETTKGGKTITTTELEADTDETIMATNGNITWTGNTDEIIWLIGGTGSIKSMTITLKSGLSGIEEVEATEEADAPAVFYNLQGVRVANPENGVYIRVQGRNATKILVK